MPDQKTENDPLVESKDTFDEDNTRTEMSVQEILDRGKFSAIDFMYIIALGLIAIADSLQAAYIALITPTLTCLWSLNASQQSALTSITFMGTGAGAIFIGPLSDRFGRKPSSIATTTALFLAMISSAASMNYPMFLVFSVIAGMSVGGSLTIAFTYWAEVSGTSFRNCGVMTITMFWSSGILVSNALALIAMNSIGWRMYTFLMAIPAIVPAIILLFLPESPKYLNSVGNVEGTISALRKKLKTSYPTLNLNDTTILKESQTETNSRGRTNTGKSIIHLFQTICSDGLRSDTLKIIGIYSCLQIGFKGILYIGTAILATNMCDGSNEHLVSNNSGNSTIGEKDCPTLDNSDFEKGALLSLSLFVSTILTMFLIKKYGEYWSLRFLSVGTLFSSIPVIFCLPSHMQLVSIALMAVGLAGISLVFYVILPKIYPTIARNSGFGLVDGVGKMVASLAVYPLVTIISYSIRGAIGFMIGITALLMIQILVLRNITDSSYDTIRPSGNELRIVPHQG